MTRLPKHTEKVRTLLAQVEADRDSMLKLMISGFSAPGSQMFSLDLMAFGAAKRNVSTACAFRMMIESWNMVCARALLRIHIDTSLRFSAAWLVDKPHEFATQVLSGEQINKIKGKDGKQLSDARLVEARTSEHPWLPAVYKNLSGYVHFSGAHIYDAVAETDTDDSTVSFEISETDLKFPEFSWIEILECFRETTAMLSKFLSGYSATKLLSPAELEAAKNFSN